MNIKQVLVLCLLFAGIIAAPVQSQTRVTNPTAAQLKACGLPPHSIINSSASITEYNLTADCEISTSETGASGTAYLWARTSITINGNGYSIIGPADRGPFIWINDGATVTLNNAIIRQTGVASQNLIDVYSGTFNGSNLILTGNNGRTLAHARSGQTVSLTNVYAYDNTVAAAAMEAAGAGGNVVINGGIFLRNSGSATVIVARPEAGGGSVTLQGCITFTDNVQSDGTTAANNYSGNVNVAGITGACPPQFAYWLTLTPQPKKKSKATATPWPSATPRPPESYSQEYTELQEETGITITTAHGLGSGVHFRQLDGAGIGVQALIDAGPLAAIDVYGYVEQGIEICFPHVGRVIFLDAATMPRAMMPLEAWQDDGATCVSIDRPGSLVLLPPA